MSILESLEKLTVTPSDPADDVRNHEPAQSQTPSDHIYKVIGRRTYDIKTKRDRVTCSISGICQLPDGQTVDQENCNLKLLSANTYTVQHDLDFKVPGFPDDICLTEGTEVAVTVFSYDYVWKVYIIKAENGKLYHTRNFDLDHVCAGIAYQNAKLYVGSFNAFYVYNLSGKKLQKIFEDNSSEDKIIPRFCCRNDGKRIYIIQNEKNCLLTLNNFGDPTFTHKNSWLKLPTQPTDVCVTENGSVFVSAHHSVLQVDSEGRRKMTKVVRDNEMEYMAECMYYDRKSKSLLFGRYQQDFLLVLQLK